MYEESWFNQTVSDLNRHEGFRPFPYPDPLSKLGKKYRGSKWGWGYHPAQELLVKYREKASDGRPWTNGHGFTHGVTPFTPEISLRDSLDELAFELSEHITVLDTLVPEWREYPVYVKTVLASLAYNLGGERLGKFKNTLASFRARNWKAAADGLERSLWYTQTGDRAEELVKRLRTGQIEKRHLIPDFSNVQSGSSTVEDT